MRLHPIKHFNTITSHKFRVMRYCFACGLYLQGLCHDMSKYTPTEFYIGMKYYKGTYSPNDAERKARGYSSAWLHHKGHNKHHLEYWIDYNPKGEFPLAGMEMPLKYVCEMVCDRIAASEIYLKDNYTNASAYEYYDRGRNHLILHEKTRELLEKLLIMVRDEGKEQTFKYMKQLLKQK